jgi:hypothetical protein
MVAAPLECIQTLAPPRREFPISQPSTQTAPVGLFLRHDLEIADPLALLDPVPGLRATRDRSCQVNSTHTVDKESTIDCVRVCVYVCVCWGAGRDALEAVPAPT